MDEFELEQLRRQPKWLSILGLYQRVALEKREQVADFDGWVPRILSVNDIPDGELPGIHGKLIAFGFLKFDLAGRDGGIRYQLTPLGKQGLNSGVPTESEDEEAHGLNILGSVDDPVVAGVN